MASGEGINGIVLRDPRQFDAEVATLTSDVGELLTRRATRVLTLVSPIPRFSPDRTVAGSLFATEGVRRVFSMLALGRNVRTFRAPWSRALYAYLNALVAEGGDLVLPVSAPGPQHPLGWSREALEELFAQRGEPVGERYVRLRAQTSFAPAPSVLSWFVEGLSGLVHSQVLVRSNRTALSAALLDPLAEELVVSGMDDLQRRLPLDDGWMSDGSAVELTQQLARMTRSVSYLVAGLAHKAAASRHAIAVYGRSGPQEVVDIGGAFGFLAAELLLDDGLDVRAALNVEYDANYADGALRMYRALGPELRGRLGMALDRAEAHEFGSPVTCVTMMSSLLYVPKERRRHLLDKSWDALVSGGLLIVYEVLRSDPPAKDDAIQYTASTIDAELGRYGPVVRLGATTLRELSVDEAGEATVFRIVVKA
jgi:hypothetical protein